MILNYMDRPFPGGGGERPLSCEQGQSWVVASMARFEASERVGGLDYETAR
jgi:hypothetical protein